MLEPSERRRLREIELGLRNDDPEFADRIETRSGPRRDSGGSRQLYALMGIGVVVALFGLLAPVFYAVGLSVALTSVVVRLATAWLDRRKPLADDEDVEPGPEDDDPGSGELRV
jgi:hypothetical protein